jgi:hypothetical protein
MMAVDSKRPVLVRDSPDWFCICICENEQLFDVFVSAKVDCSTAVLPFVRNSIA